MSYACPPRLFEIATFAAEICIEVEVRDLGAETQQHGPQAMP